MNRIFVFASNLAGRHGAGSALEAMRHWGAIRGRGVGRQGNSYAIPTKDARLKVLPLERIKPYVDEFQLYAHVHPTLSFYVVPIGCGLAGYAPIEIAPTISLQTLCCIQIYKKLKIVWVPE